MVNFNDMGHKIQIRSMPDPCRGLFLLTTLVTDSIQKRRGQPGLFTFRYKLLPKLLTDFNLYMDQTLVYT